MKNLLFLVLAMFLFLGNSCQKEEIIPLEIENQEVVYTYQATLDENGAVFGGYGPVPTTCDCNLNVRANRNTTNISTDFDSDWRVSARLKTSPTTWTTISSVGFSGAAYSLSDNVDGGPLGKWKNYPFTVSKGANLQLNVAGPNTNSDYLNTTVYATISCILANQNPISQNHTGETNAPRVYGSVTNDCSAIAAF